MHTLSYKRDKKLLTFENEEQSYTIGNKQFPLSKKKNIGLWFHENTEPVKPNEKFLYFLDHISNHTFTTGKCYRNSEMVRLLGEKLQMNIKFYAGWLFHPYIKMPLFHAWNVLDNRILIDTSLTKTYFTVQEKTLEYATSNPNLTINDHRQYMVKLYEEIKQNPVPISKDLLYGKIPQGMIFYGCEDTYLSSQNRIDTLLQQPHPSYPHNRNEMGESDLQVMLKEKGLF